MKKRALLLLASLGVLVTVLVYGTIAWYTNISNVAGMTFDVAEFEFKTNYAGENFLIQVDDYLTSNADKAAPGTGGVIPIRVSVKGDSGAAYAINLDFTGMEEEFKERIRFFYYVLEDGKYVEKLLDGETEDIVGTIKAGNNGVESAVTEYIYWEWIYTADITPILVSPRMVDGQIIFTEDFEHMDEMTYDEIRRAVDNWVTYLGAGNATVQAKYEELEALGHLELMDPKSADFRALTNGDPTGRELKTLIEETYLDEHDAFDTALAMGDYNANYTSRDGSVYTEGTTTVVENGVEKEIPLLAYQQAMEVQLLVSGAQAAPLKKGEVESWGSEGTTEYLAVRP